MVEIEEKLKVERERNIELQCSFWLQLLPLLVKNLLTSEFDLRAASSLPLFPFHSTNCFFHFLTSQSQLLPTDNEFRVSPLTSICVRSVIRNHVEAHVACLLADYTYNHLAVRVEAAACGRC